MTKEESFGDVFETLRTAGIRFCALRSDLDCLESDNELDILVSRDQSCDAIVELGRLGFRVKVPERFIPHKLALMRFNAKSFQVIDLHMEVVQDGYVFMDAHSVLERRHAVRGFFMPSDTDFLVILVIHNIVGKGQIQAKQFQEIRNLATVVVSNSIFESLIKSPGLSRLIVRVLKCPDAYSEKSEETRILRDGLIRALRRNDPRSYYFRARRSVARILRRYSPMTKAPFYVFLGVDGVGKSSLCTALVDTFNDHGILRATQFYMGPWGHYLLSCMRGEMFVPGWSISFSEWRASITEKTDDVTFTLWDVIRISRKTSKGEMSNDAESELHRKIRSHSKLYLTARFLRSTLAAWRFLATLMLEMGYWYFTIYKLRRQGTIVIAHRYIYDLLTGRMHEEVRNYERTRRVLCRVFFRRSKTFLLTNDSQTILERKTDLSPG